MTDPDFFESRAIVLSKMGQHKQALQIYVFQLKDYAKAEESVYLHSHLLTLTNRADTAIRSSSPHQPP